MIFAGLRISINVLVYVVENYLLKKYIILLSRVKIKNSKKTINKIKNKTNIYTDIID